MLKSEFCELIKPYKAKTHWSASDRVKIIDLVMGLDDAYYTREEVESLNDAELLWFIKQECPEVIEADNSEFCEKIKPYIVKGSYRWEVSDRIEIRKLIATLVSGQFSRTVEQLDKSSNDELLWYIKQICPELIDTPPPPPPVIEPSPPPVVVPPPPPPVVVPPPPPPVVVPPPPPPVVVPPSSVVVPPKEAGYFNINFLDGIKYTFNINLGSTGDKSQSYSLLRVNLFLIILFMTFDKDDEDDRVYIKYALAAAGLYGVYSMVYNTSHSGGGGGGVDTGGGGDGGGGVELPVLNIHDMNYREFLATEKFITEPIIGGNRNFVVGNLAAMTQVPVGVLGSYSNEDLVRILQMVSDLIPSYSESDLDRTTLPLIQTFTDANIPAHMRNFVVHHLDKIMGGGRADELGKFDVFAYQVIIIRLTGTSGLPLINVNKLNFEHYSPIKNYISEPIPEDMRAYAVHHLSLMTGISTIILGKYGNVDLRRLLIKAFGLIPNYIKETLDLTTWDEVEPFVRTPIPAHMRNFVLQRLNKITLIDYAVLAMFDNFVYRIMLQRILIDSGGSIPKFIMTTFPLIVEYGTTGIPATERNFVVYHLDKIHGGGEATRLGTMTNPELEQLIRDINEEDSGKLILGYDLTTFPLIEMYATTDIPASERNLVVYHLNKITSISATDLGARTNNALTPIIRYIRDRIPK